MPRGAGRAPLQTGAEIGVGCVAVLVGEECTVFVTHGRLAMYRHVFGARVHSLAAAPLGGDEKPSV